MLSRPKQSRRKLYVHILRYTANAMEMLRTRVLLLTGRIKFVLGSLNSQPFSHHIKEKARPTITTENFHEIMYKAMEKTVNVGRLKLCGQR